MADYDIKYPNEYTDKIKKLTIDDKGHATVFNQVISLLINNDSFLKSVCDLAELHMKNSDIHVTKADKTKWDAKAEPNLSTESVQGLMSAEDKAKLNTVKMDAEENQNAFSNIKVGTSSIGANGKMAQIQFVAGENITISGDNATKTVTIKAEGGGNYIGVSPPAKTNLLWTDTSVGGVLKYFNGTAWIPVKSVWG